MAISIDWATKVITVPKIDTTLVQSNPIEIRELNLNTFRLALKDLEDDAVGMTFLDTHSHNTEVLLGGITYARVLEIINGYTVTFEDGAYAVNLVGANSNVGDVLNLNSVSVRSSNSAGLTSTTATEFASYQNHIVIDAVNGVAGTIFPTGTGQQPSNNLVDAILIAEFRGLTTFLIKGTFTITNSDISGYTFEGDNPLTSVLVLSGTGNTTTDCEFRDLQLGGRLNGAAFIEECGIQALSNVGSTIFPTIFRSCILRIDVGLTPAIEVSATANQNLHLIECVSGVPGGQGQPTIDYNGSESLVSFRKYTGGIKITNQTNALAYGSYDIDSGKVVIADSCTAGSMVFRGVGRVQDELGDVIPTGTHNGVSITNQMLTEGEIGAWTIAEKNNSLMYSKKASDNAEQLNTRL